MSFTELLNSGLLLMDGAMGTMLSQSSSSSSSSSGVCDLLSMERPELVLAAHRAYLEAGAVIITTNTINSNALTFARLGVDAGLVAQINCAAAQLARRAVDRYMDGRCAVAGSVGPIVVSDFGRMVDVYAVQIRALVDGGVDVVLMETMCSTAACRAAVVAMREVLGLVDFPIIISATLGADGCLPGDGATVEDFFGAMDFAGAAVYGLNCGRRAEDVVSQIENLRQVADAGSTMGCGAIKVMLCPSVSVGVGGSPIEFGTLLAPYIADRKVDIIGGCCGTTPEHIKVLDAMCLL